MLLLGLLPVLLIVLLTLALTTWKADPLAGFGECVVFAFLGWGVLTVVVTEVLSLFHLLRPVPIALSWLLINILVGVILSVRWDRFGSMQRTRNRLNSGHKVLYVLVLVPVLTTLVIGLISPPNTWDAMTYHLPRVMHWIQNGTVAHYSTDNARQLFMPPFAGFAVLHLQLLSGEDRFANLPQWLAMLGCLVGVALISKQLGAPRRGQLLAVAFVATLPTGVLQATTAQTDYLTALWLVFAVFLLRRDIDTDAIVYKLGSGVAIGLAVLTKPTAYLFLSPFVVWYFIVKLRRSPQGALLGLLAVAVVTLGLNAGHFDRNIRWVGNPFGPRQLRTGHTNARYGLDVTFSNAMLNLGAHLGTREAWNDKVEESLRSIHERAGIKVDDPAIRVSRFELRPMNTHEDHAGNPLHLLLIAASLLLIVISARLRGRARLVLYAGLVAAGAVVFSAYLSWDPFRARLHLPLFILAAPAVGLTLDTTLRRPLGEILAVCLLFAALPSLLAMRPRPVIAWNVFSGNAPSILRTPRASLYFRSKPPLERPFREATTALSRLPCKIIGIVSTDDGLVYPLWVLLRAESATFQLTYSEPDYEIEGYTGQRACARIFVGPREGLRERMRIQNGEAWLYEADYLSVVGPQSGKESPSRH